MILFHIAFCLGVTWVARSLLFDCDDVKRRIEQKIYFARKDSSQC